MWHNFLFDASFHHALYRIDQQLAAECCARGCPHCGGVLHWASFPRKPYGVAERFRHFYGARLSLCCASCRRRVTTPSVRFFARRRYVAAVFVLISALRLGLNERRRRQLQQHFGIAVSLDTWKRWRRFWRQRFEDSAFWRQVKGRFIPPPDRLPRALLSAFVANALEQRLVLFLRFLTPITGGRSSAI